MLSFEEGREGTPVTLGPNQELKASSLNDLRTAVQGLEIVNVRRKPKGLAADLKADASLMENKESLVSLRDQGFFPQETPNGPEIYATAGETIVGTQNAVQYVLRFGEVVQSLASTDSEKDGEIGGLQRYLLVTARLDESKFPIPDIQPLPETIEDLKKLESAAQAAAAEPAVEPVPAEQPPAPAEPQTDTEKPPSPPTKEATKTETTEEPAAEKPATEQPKPEEPKDPAAPAAEPKSEAALNSCDPQDAAATQEPAADKVAEKQAETPAADKPATDSPAAAQSPDTKPAPGAKPAAQKVETEEELKDRLEATRERIAKENQRKIDDRNEKIAASRKKVQELNARFSDWYYVVSDTAYKKLKISRDQLIVPKGSGNATPPAGGAGLQGFPGGPGGLPPGFPGNN
jgi:hypothetical protein